jgi:para-nitrobenzyl esterase
LCGLAAATTTSAAIASPSPGGPAARQPCTAGTTVQTSTGPICGIVTNGDDQWLGIPYAAPPVGPLRWQPPRPHAPWTTTLSATAFGSPCVQPPPPPATEPTMTGSEDCLYLNVVRPLGVEPSAKLPVLVHIHAGGFQRGFGNADYSLLANTGHEVIVSMNYRLGVFGFEANRAFGPHSGDYGLQDQQAALRWVKDNVATFGGDPHNVTIFGESAGASSVCDQLASPTAAGLFEKAISTSGEYNSLFGTPGWAPAHLEPQDCKAGLPTQQQANLLGDQYAHAAGCGGATDVAACMRNLSTETAFTAAGNGYQYGGAGTIAPTLNGSTLVSSPREAFRNGTENRVPVIAGVGRDEDLNGWPTSASEYRDLVDAQYGRYASDVMKLYPASRFYSPAVAFRTVSADSTTVCQSLITDQLLARHMPVYAYEMDDGSQPGPFYLPTDAPVGAFHVVGWNLYPTSGLDLNEQVLQDQVLAEVTTFARSGSPTAQTTPNWPQFNHSHLVMSLAPGGDSELMTTAQISLVHNCGFWKGITPNPK